jgi:ferric-dicitrate binding protein FerR (iron transport regulator)
LLSANGGPGYANEIMDKIWESSFRNTPGTALTGNAWQEVEKQINTKSGRIISLHSISRRKWLVAASLLVIVLSAATFFVWNRKTNTVSSVAAQKKINHVITQPGSKSKIELPDGTQVWLNGNSQLSYADGNFGANGREVSLTGEAFFDVVTATTKTGEKNPFIIHTGSITITVKGTAFNVKAYPHAKTIETSLVRGIIEITTKQDPDRKIVLKPNEKIIIPVDTPATEHKKENASGTSVYTITSLYKDKSHIIPETVWIQNKLEFDDEPLGELAPKMEEWFNIKIVFQDEDIKTRKFSGVIEKETLKETLQAMQLSYHFGYTIKGNELYITKK